MPPEQCRPAPELRRFRSLELANLIWIVGNLRCLIENFKLTPTPLTAQLRRKHLAPYFLDSMDSDYLVGALEEQKERSLTPSRLSDAVR